MLNKKNEISLLYDLSEMLAQELTINESSNILRAISIIGKGNKIIKQIVDDMQNITLDNSMHHLEKSFNKNIQQLKIIKQFVKIAKKYSLEPQYSFQNHSLIAVLEMLNIFFSKKVSIDNGLKYTLAEMVYEIKFNSKALQRSCNNIDKTTFENDEQILGVISFLRFYIGNINQNIEIIREILEAPPRTKKSKKKNKKHLKNSGLATNKVN